MWQRIWLLIKELWRLVRGEDDRAQGQVAARAAAPYRGRVVLVLVAMLAATGAGLAPPYLVGQAIDAGIQSGDVGALRLVVAAFLLTAVVYWGATYAETYLVGWVGQRALQDLRQRILAHLQAMSIGFFTRRRPRC